jgi:hypothetical protein
MAANDTNATLTIGHSRSLRQLFVGLLAHHLLGVPIWPVGVGFPSPRFMLLVRHRGANHRLARSRTEEYVVSPGTRAGSRFVTSCSDQPLPSGSLNETKDP